MIEKTETNWGWINTMKDGDRIDFLGILVVRKEKGFLCLYHKIIYKFETKTSAMKFLKAWNGINNIFLT